MPALFNYPDGRFGSHGVFMCKDGQALNVPIDIANQYAESGWVQCDAPTITPVISVSPQIPTVLPTVGAGDDLWVCFGIALILLGSFWFGLKIRGRR